MCHAGVMTRKSTYPSDVTDDEWVFAAPYLTLMRADAPQREYDLRVIFNGLRRIVRTGSPWRYTPNDPPPWEMVYQQTQRWIRRAFSKRWCTIYGNCCGWRPGVSPNLRRW